MRAAIKAAPMAPTSCGYSGTLTGTPSSSESSLLNEGLVASPPVNVHSPRKGMRAARPRIRRAMERKTPRKQADDFRLREYGAHAGNGGGLSLSGGFTEFRQLHAEDAGKDL